MSYKDMQLLDEGTDIILNITDNGTIVDLSAATVKTIKLKPPEGALITKTGADVIFTTDGTDGKIQYTVEPGVLNELGVWRVQGYVEFSNGKWHSSKDRFRVRDNL